MKTKLLLAASVAIALAGPAFAQGIDPGQPARLATAAQPVQQAARQNEPTEEKNEAASKLMSPVGRPIAHASRRHCPVSTVALADSVAPVISDNARQLSAANTYDPCKDALTKVYPKVDRGHVEGDPPIIDHSADVAPVTPTDSVAAVPFDE